MRKFNFSTLITSLILAGCAAPSGFMKLNTGGTALNSDPDVAAFQRTVYPIARNYCIACHTTTAPYHASDDPVKAYNGLISGQKINFSNPDISDIVQQLGIRKHNCWNGDCDASAKQMSAAIAQWRVLRGSDLLPGQTAVRFMTDAMVIPASVPFCRFTQAGGQLSQAKSTLTYSVANAVLGVNFLVDICLTDSSSYSYLVQNLRFTGPNGTVMYVKNISVSFNGTTSTQATGFQYLDSDFTISANSSLPAITNTTPLVCLQPACAAGTDQLSFMFEYLKAGSGPD